MNFFSLFKRKLIYKFKKKISIDTLKVENRSLDELFYHYGSDKSEILRINNQKGHGFSKFYNNYLNNFKNKEINILEIGSYSGASAAAFAKFLPKSKVFCFDINISNFRFSSKNIKVFGLDVGNKIKVQKILKKLFKKNNFNLFDLIIDDGSHNLSDILSNLSFFFKYLKKKGLFVIEDYKFPNYYDYNRNIDDILIDKLIDNIKNKKYFSSKTINKNDQEYLINSIHEIKTFKGNLTNSDICFIEKI